MKFKTKILSLSSAATLTAAAVAPAVLLTSCSKENDPMVEPLKTETIAQFKEIAKVNRPSNMPGEETNLNGIRKHCLDTIKSLGLTYEDQGDKIIDNNGNWLAQGNILFDIPASEDGKDIPTIILQGHLDLVYANVDDETGKDKMKYTIELEEVDSDKGPILQSKGNKTSIGADDGLGVATMFAIAKHRNEFRHGKIRCILTTDEEVGLVGAREVPCGREKTDTTEADKQNWFLEDYTKPKESSDNGYIKYLLNLDWEDMNTLALGSNGGVDSKMWRNFQTSEIETTFTNYTAYEIKAEKFAGGHSGIDYNNNHSSPFSTILKVMQEQLSDSYYNIEYNYGLMLIDISSDSDTNNKIPTKASMKFFLNNEFTNEKLTKFQDAVKKAQEEARSHCDADKDATLTFSKVTSTSTIQKALKNELSNKVLGLLGQLGIGVFIPESAVGYHSSSNVAPVELDLTKTSPTATDPHLKIWIYSRSFDKTILDYLAYTATAIYDYFLYVDDATESGFTQGGKYEPWFPKGENPIIDIIKDAYNRTTDITPKDVLVGGGIENSMWFKASPTTSMASIGPTLKDVHSVKEGIYLNSINPFLNVLLYTFKNIK